MRLEYKYLLNDWDVNRIRREMLPFIEGDFNYSSSNCYTVRSIYFDTARLKYYWEKIEGFSTRKKVRVRGYNQLENKNVVFLEVKRKHQSHVFKDRSPALYEDIDELMATKNIDDFVISKNNPEGVKEDAEKFFHHVHKRSLIPIVLIVYDRDAYYSKFNKKLRITFDSNLRYYAFPTIEELYNNNNLVQSFPNKTILEVKFEGGFPSWLQSILTDNGLYRRALSKYIICVDHAKRFNPLLKSKIILTNPSFNNEYAGEIEIT